MLLGLGYMVIAGSLAGTAGRVPGNGSVQAIGEVLFTKYLLPFELASVLLLVAMIGAVVLARKPRINILNARNSDMQLETCNLVL